MIALIDSNVLARILNPADQLHQTVRTALRILKRSGHTFAVNQQIAAEFWSLCTRPATSRNGLGLSTEQTDDRLTRLTARWPVVEDKPDSFAIWHKLVVDVKALGRQVHDARIAAAMKSHGIQYLVTFNDSDFKRYPDVVTINPSRVLEEQPA